VPRIEVFKRILDPIGRMGGIDEPEGTESLIALFGLSDHGVPNVPNVVLHLLFVPLVSGPRSEVE